jgi:hypothetical protein
LRAAQRTLDSGRTKGYENGRTEQSVFRSGNSRKSLRTEDRAECISVREFTEILTVLMRTLIERVKKEWIYSWRLCVDNSSIVHVTNAFVASSRPMMRNIVA